MKNILVVYASAGEGHKKAAIAIYEELRKKLTDSAKVTLIDSLDYSNVFFKFCYKMGYIFMVKYIPSIWGFFYYILDNRFFFMLNQPFRVLINTINTRKLVKFLKQEKFDLCVSTHFMSTEIISRLKREKKADIKLLTVITDFQTHLFWISKQVDHYAVGADDTKKQLMHYGLDSASITVTGIPIESKFSEVKNKQDIITRLGIKEKKFTVLVMGGGFGVGPIEEIVRGLQFVENDFQIIVVCGRNKKLYDKLSKEKNNYKKPTYVFGFCNNMDEIMYVSDFMISKVGGLSSSEALSSRLVIIAISPIPGQEMRNTKFLLRNNIGFIIKKPKDAAKIIKDLILDETAFQEIREKISLFAKPDAGAKIAQIALKLLT